MKFANFASLVRFNTRTDSNTFTDSDIILGANTFKDVIALEIKKVNEDYFGSYLTRDLVADKREYSLPSDLLSAIERVEAKINGTDWKVLNELELPLVETPTSEESIREFFTWKGGHYDLFRGSLFLYSEQPIIDVVGGLKLWAMLFPSDFANLTDDRDMSVPLNDTSIGFPREFHSLLATRVGIWYKERQEVPIPLTKTELTYEQDLKKALDCVRISNFDRSIGVQETVDNGENY